MFKPFYFFIGTRYVSWHKNSKNNAIAFFSLISMIGISLGVTALITVLSVMNGFRKEIQNELLSGEPHFVMTAQLENFDTRQTFWRELLIDLKQLKLGAQVRMVGVAPYVLGQGLLNTSESSHGLMIEGIDPDLINQIIPLSEKLVTQTRLGNQRLTDIPLEAGKFGILLGQSVGRSLGLKVGDSVTLMIPNTQISPMGVMPRLKQFTVMGFFDMTTAFNWTHGLIHIQDAQKLFSMKESVTGLQFKLSDPLFAEQASLKIMTDLSQHPYYHNTPIVIQTWMDKYESYFRTIQMEKTVMTYILVLIIAVAAFNLVSSLIMIVSEKQADISILRAMGATPRQIMAIFMIQGGLIGGIGIILGVFGGIILSSYATEIVQILQSWLGTTLVNKDAYFLDYLPSDIQGWDIFMVVCVALGLSLLATVYPAYRAACVQPAEGLKYE